MDTDQTPETIQMTGAQIRKLARLARLHPDAMIKVEQTSDEAIHVEFLDEYGYRVTGLNGGRKDCYAFVIRENGWSNPSVKRATDTLASAR
jgi:hypothetical protein